MSALTTPLYAPRSPAKVLEQLRAWVEVEPAAITHNVRQCAAYVGDETDICAVVKANGYGHGAILSAWAALEGGAKVLGVVTVPEALEIRSHFPEARILMMGAAAPEEFESILAADLDVTLYDLGVLPKLREISHSLRKPCRVHLKVETGMSRLGLMIEEAQSAAREIVADPYLHLEAICTQLPVGNESAVTSEQLAAFAELTRYFPERRRHCANSAATFSLREAQMEMVRLGAAIYGFSTIHPAPLPVALKPALRWRARVMQVKRLNPGDTVSYNRTFTAQRPTVIAVIGCGYADGYPRSLSNRAEVLLNGIRCPVRGLVCMDFMMVDVTEAGAVTPGDAATLLGDGLTLNELAHWAATTPHEICSRLGNRLERVVV